MKNTGQTSYKLQFLFNEYNLLPSIKQQINPYLKNSFKNCHFSNPSQNRDGHYINQFLCS